MSAARDAALAELRARLPAGQVVAGDADRLEPYGRDESELGAYPPDAVVVNDVPLLVEAGLASSFDLVIVVMASEEIRIARLQQTRGMTEDEARARIAKQATDEQRRSVADVEIVNEGTLEELVAAVDATWEQAILPKLHG